MSFARGQILGRILPSSIRRGLLLGILAMPGFAEEQQTLVVDDGQGGKTTITVPKGAVVKITSADGQTLSTVNGVSTQRPPPVVPESKSDATPSRWDLDCFAGLRFGGIIGASFDNTLSYNLHQALAPELIADIGVGGVTLGLGARWSLSKQEWTLSSEGLSVDYDSNTAICLRAIAPYRWEDRHRSPSLWRGIVTDGGWYYGGEVDVLVKNVALAAQATWEQTHHTHAPRFTLAYGFGF